MREKLGTGWKRTNGKIKLGLGDVQQKLVHKWLVRWENNRRPTVASSRMNEMIWVDGWGVTPSLVLGLNFWFVLLCFVVHLDFESLVFDKSIKLTVLDMLLFVISSAKEEQHYFEHFKLSLRKFNSIMTDTFMQSSHSHPPASAPCVSLYGGCKRSESNSAINFIRLNGWF